MTAQAPGKTLSNPSTTIGYVVKCYIAFTEDAGAVVPVPIFPAQPFVLRLLERLHEWQLRVIHDF